jgi:hypothetical protein
MLIYLSGVDVRPLLVRTPDGHDLEAALPGCGVFVEVAKRSDDSKFGYRTSGEEDNLRFCHNFSDKV